MRTTLLSGTTIVEVAHAHTEYAGLLLAGLGADVYLLEAPEGSPTRRRRPQLPGGDPARRSIPFLARNLGKRSIVIDPSNEADLERLRQLVDRADGVLAADTAPLTQLVETLAPGVPRVTVTDRLGLGSSSIVPFAASGGLVSSGWPDRPPCNAPGWLAIDGAGIYAAVMLLISMRCGLPPIEVPLEEAAVAAVTPWTRPLHSYGMTIAGQGIESARLGPLPYPILKCKDGYIRVLTATPGQWEGWVKVLGSPEALLVPEWDDLAFRAANVDAMAAVAQEIVAEWSMMDLFEEGQRHGVTISPILEVDGFLEDPHVAARELFHELQDPDCGWVRMMRPPVRVPGVETVQWTPAPALARGETELPPTPATRRRGPGQGTDLKRPLAGLRVLNLGFGAVVPEAASLLALLGADVIKVESRRHLDFLRQSRLPGADSHDSSPTFNQMNLGVKSLAVDMSTEEGRALVRDLALKCDVVMENMRGPVTARWGLDYATLSAVRPDIIYLSSQGLGDGPYGGYQTYGPNLQTFSGVTALWAHPDDPYPVGSGLNHPDHTAGKQALAAVLAALIRRERTGQGCFLDCAQFEAAAYLIADRFLQHQLLPGSVQPLGNRSPEMAPHGCYPCEGQDSWCAIAVENDEQWRQLSTAIGEEWARRPEFATEAGRLEHAAELDELLSGWTRRQSPADLEQLLRPLGVPISRLLTGDDFASQEVESEGGLFACVSHPVAGSRWYTGLPVMLASGERYPVRRAPMLGEHDEYVLFDILGLDEARVSHLVASGVIGF